MSITKIVKGVLSDMGEVATTATYVKSGQALYQHLAGIITPDDPAIAERHLLDTPIKRFAAAFAADLGRELSMPDEPLLALGTKAMLQAAAYDLSKEYRIGGFLSDLKANPEAVKQMLAGATPVNALPAPNEDGQDSREKEIKSLFGVGTAMHVQFQQELDDKHKEAKEKRLHVCPRCVAKVRVPDVEGIKSMKLHKGTSMGKFSHESSSIDMLAAKWEGQVVCGGCRTELNNSVNSLLRLRREADEKAAERETKEQLLADAIADLEATKANAAGKAAELESTTTALFAMCEHTEVKGEKKLTKVNGKPKFHAGMETVGQPIYDKYVELTKEMAGVNAKLAEQEGTVASTQAWLDGDVADGPVDESAQVESSNAKPSVTKGKADAKSKAPAKSAGARASAAKSKKSKSKSKSKSKK